MQALKPITSRVRTENTAIKREGIEGSRWTDEPLTQARLLEHVSGGAARGVCPIRRGETTTRIALLDLDSHKGLTPWPEMQRHARDIRDALDMWGYPSVPFRSSGGRGIHIVMLWDTPQDAYSVRETMRTILACIGFSDGAGGVANRQLEVFPKQSEIATTGFGNQFILPLAGKSVPLDESMAPLPRESLIAMFWPTSTPVMLHDRPVLSTTVHGEPDPIDKVRRAVQAIPNDGTHAEMDYDFWFRHICAIHEALGGGLDAFAAAVEFSERNPIFRREYFETRVWPYIKPRAGGVTRATLYSEAGKWVLDWNSTPNTADGFDDMPISNAPAYQPYDDLGDHSDTGNANLLRRFAQGDMRFVAERNSWMYWTGEHWEVDDIGSRAQKSALGVGKHYLAKYEAMNRQAKDQSLESAEQKKLLKVAEAFKAWATTCRNKHSITNMLAIASRDPWMVIRSAELDRDPWLFGVSNGVVDLRTGRLRAAGRDDLVTKRSTAAFRSGAPAPRWRDFIDEITGVPIDGAPGSYEKRPDLAAYLQRMCGYLMTGTTAEHKMFIPHGKGSNGKNVLLDIVQEVMGDYCVTIPPEALMATRHDGDAEKPSSVAATLAGARAAISSESKEGQKLDVALVKRHTGGGFMNARLMRENSFRFAISHKLVLMTNHRPTLDHMDEAIRGRLHMIPFDRVWNRPGHPDRNPALPDGDKGLMDALRAESEGVLAWLVEGAVLYHRDGLVPPGEVTKATRDYFATEDSFGQWLETMEPCEPKSGMRGSELFTHYTTHCINEARRPSIASQTAFSIELKKRGVSNKVLSDGTYYGLTYGGLIGSGGLF